MSRIAGFAFLFLCACASPPLPPQAFSFGVMGDTPYGSEEEKRFVAMIERMNRAALAFVVHVGDFKGGGACTDALFERRREQFNASRHPLIYTPGDNEWTDCRDKAIGPSHPLERLAQLRRVFFAEPRSLGRQPIETAVQKACAESRGDMCACPALPENRRWIEGYVVFVTLNIPGSNNGVGRDAAGNEEARCRDLANARWLDEAVEESTARGVRGLVIFVQADPWATPKPVYKPFLAHLEAAARRLAKPVLFVHGDSHTYVVDNPFRDALGNPIGNLTRMETFGSPMVGWVEVTVNPESAQLFTFEPHLFAIVR